MPVRVRLKRMGNKNRAFYRVVAADGRTATNGRFVENLGWYNPLVDGVNFKLDLARVDYWLGNGAIFSNTVNNLVKRARALPPEEAAAPAPEPEVATEEPVAEAAPEEAPAVEEAAPASDDAAAPAPADA